MKCRHGPATVTGSKPIVCHWDESLGKVWARNDPQVRRTACLTITDLPTNDGEGITGKHAVIGASVIAKNFHFDSSLSSREESLFLKIA